MTKKLIIIGSTGSIGTQTLDVVRAYPDRFQVAALAAGRNTVLMEAQIRALSACGPKKPRRIFGSGWRT